MKKNTALRIAGAVAVLALASTCAISGTFAKYVTSGTGSDEARVAKWGVTIAGVATDNAMFANSYKNGESEVIVQATPDVVAPGTSGTFSQFDISGTPEVAVKISYDATVTLTGWTVDLDGAGEGQAEYYCPIVVKVNNEAVETTGVASASDYATAIQNAIEAVTATYAPGTDLSALEDDLAITWEWAFEVDNAKDTALGNAEDAGENVNTISISVTATIEQVQDLPNA